MKVTELKEMHSQWVNQVAYYESLKAFVSSSKCGRCSVLISDLTGSRIQYKFHVNMGVSCFTVCEGTFNEIGIYFHFNLHILIVWKI